MRSIVVQAGPLASAGATKVAPAQRNYGAAAGLSLSGSLSDVITTTVCASQSPAAAAFTINGTQATGGIAYLQNQYLSFVFSGDSHTRTLAVVGLDINSAIQKETVTCGNVQAIGSLYRYTQIISITPSGSITGNVTVGSYDPVPLDTARKVLFTTTADETANVATIVGTNWGGSVITEAVTLVNNGTVATLLDYLSVASVVITSAAAGNISVGTNGVASSPWVYLDPWSMSQVGIQVTVTGTANYTVQQSIDDPNSPTNVVAPAAMAWVNHADPAMVAATTTLQSNYAYPPIWARVVLNSESGTGHVVASFVQALSAVY